MCLDAPGHGPVDVTLYCDDVWYPIEHGFDDRRAMAVAVSLSAPGTPLDSAALTAEENQRFLLPQPDADGLYAPEEIEGLGHLRWTDAISMHEVLPARGSVTLFLSTNQPNGAAVAVSLGSGGYEAHVRPHIWNRMDLPAPVDQPADLPMRVGLFVRDHFYPMDEGLSADRRCLGVMVALGHSPMDAQPVTLTAVQARTRWRRNAPLLLG